MSAHLDFFALASEPFSKEIDDKDLWLPPSKKSLGDELGDAGEAREGVGVTGGRGVGKTCVLRALRHALPRTVSACPTATTPPSDDAISIASSASCPGCPPPPPPPPPSPTSRTWRASDGPTPSFSSTRPPPPSGHADHLHILLNYGGLKALLSWSSSASEDSTTASAWRNRSLASRIHRRFAIEPLTPEDTAEYLRARLTRAGCNRDLFASDAVTILHEATAGALRDVDRLATACLRVATRKKRKTVERDVVSRVVKTLAPEGM